MVRPFALLNLKMGGASEREKEKCKRRKTKKKRKETHLISGIVVDRENNRGNPLQPPIWNSQTPNKGEEKEKGGKSIFWYHKRHTRGRKQEEEQRFV